MIELWYSTSAVRLADACLADLAGLQADWPDTRAWVIVPDARKVAAERRFLELSPRGSLLTAEVLSFDRLAWRLGEESGQNRPRRLSREAMTLLVADVLSEEKDELEAFAHLTDQPAYIRRLSELLGWLRHYSVTTGLMAETAAIPGLDSRMAAKFRDYSRLLSGIESRLSADRLADRESELEWLAGLLETEPSPAGLTILQDAYVWITGFGEDRDLTPAETRIVLALDRLVSRVVITAYTDTIPGSEREQADVDPACHFGSRLALRLREQAGASLRIRALDIGPTEPPVLTTALAGSIDSEVAWCAADIERQVRSGKYRYREIAVYLADSPAYLSAIRRVFPAYDIPAFFDQRRSLSQTPLMRHVLALLDCARTNWAREPLLALLRSGPCDLTLEQADQLENFWQEYGLKHGQIFNDGRYDSAPHLLTLRRMVLDPIRLPVEQLAGLRGSAELAEGLRRILEIGQVRAWCSAEGSRLAEAGLEDARLSLVKAWNSLGTLLAELVAIHRDPELTLEHFTVLLRSGAESSSSGVIPAHLDEVNCSQSMSLTAQPVRLLYILGCREGALPRTDISTDLLRDEECDLIRLSDGRQLPGLGVTQPFQDANRIRQLLELPSEALVLSWTGELTDCFAAGQRLREARQAAGEPVKDLRISLQPEQDDDPRLADPAQLRLRLIELARDSGETVLAARHPELIELAAAAGISSAEVPSFRSQPSGVQSIKLPATMITRILGEEPALSVSALERYSACPWAWQAGYLLNAREQEVWDPQVTDIGSLLHRVYESLYSRLAEDLKTAASPEGRDQIWEEALAADTDALAAEALNEAIERDESFARFSDPAQQMRSVRQIRRIVQASWRQSVTLSKTSGLLPYAFEWRFGRDGKTLRLNLSEDRTVRLTGIIDRVDVRLDGDHLSYAVVDYKSGGNTVQPLAIASGLDLQLLTYLDVAGLTLQADYPHWTIAAAGARLQPLRAQPIQLDYRVPDPEARAGQKEQERAADYCVRAEPADLQGLLQLNRDYVRGLSDRLTAGHIDVRPRSTAARSSSARRVPCDYCAYRSACGIRYPKFETEAPPQDKLPGGLGSGLSQAAWNKLLEKTGDRESGEGDLWL